MLKKFQVNFFKAENFFNIIASIRCVRVCTCVRVADYSFVILSTHTHRIGQGGSKAQVKFKVLKETFCLKSPLVVRVWAIGGDFFCGNFYYLSF